METLHYNVIVLGAGPAGLTAGLYLSRAKVKTLVLNTGTVGGQLVLTHEVANYPGVENISGYGLASIMAKQAKSFGAEIKTIRGIATMNLKSDIKYIETTDGKSFTADAVILTPGGRSRTLGVTGENRFKGQGISYCATCDGEFFTGKEIVVVGGGNSALEEAVSLTKYATKVTIVHQFDHFQAFPHAVEEAKENPKINFIMETTIDEFLGNEKLEGVVLRNTKNGETSTFNTDGVFIFIGYQANTDFLQGHVPLNQWGEILVDNDMQTQIPGVFAAGDCIAKKYRQITAAVGEATVASLAASAYIHNKKTIFAENLN